MKWWKPDLAEWAGGPLALALVMSIRNGGNGSDRATCHLGLAKDVRTEPDRLGKEVRSATVAAPGDTLQVHLTVMGDPKLKHVLAFFSGGVARGFNVITGEGLPPGCRS